MKYTIILLISAALVGGCRKNLGECKNYKELSGQEHLVNVNAAAMPELADTLSKYPQLQLYLVQNYNSDWTAQCHVFYKGLIIFSDYYSLNKNYATGTLTTYDTILTHDPGISLMPLVSHEDAIKAAKLEANFDNLCITYRLGLYNVTAGAPFAQRKYRLVWKIQNAASSGYPYVVVDANNKQIIESSNGVWYVD